MNWFGRLIWPNRTAREVYLRGGEFEHEIVGESHYQVELESIVGGRHSESASFDCEARLIPENDNPYDPNAVRVEIDGYKVGHLSREDAKTYRSSIGNSIGICGAEILGGWERSGGRRGYFGVKLDIHWPPQTER